MNNVILDRLADITLAEARDSIATGAHSAYEYTAACQLAITALLKGKTELEARQVALAFILEHNATVNPG